MPTLVLLDGADERGRVEGLHRERMLALAAQAGVPLDLDGLPELRPGCASLTRDPEVAARLAARRARAEGRIRSRELRVGELEDPFEALHERGLTDGLPVVPPTPERVVAMLEHTSRDPQDLVGLVPPYGGEATVEKIAVNAVMAGCAGPELPVVLAAVEAVCDESFAMHGLLATTHPAGPVVVVSGFPGFHTAVNVLGQGDRASMTPGVRCSSSFATSAAAGPASRIVQPTARPGKLGLCFAERLDETAPWPGLAQDRGVPQGEPGVTVMALEAPRVIVDQLAREPEGLCASLAMALENVATPRLRLAFDAMLLVGPEHGRIFKEAGWSRAQVQERLHELTHPPPASSSAARADRPRGWRRTGSAIRRCQSRSSPLRTASCSPTRAATRACSR